MARPFDAFIQVRCYKEFKAELEEQAELVSKEISEEISVSDLVRRLTEVGIKRLREAQKGVLSER